MLLLHQLVVYILLSHVPSSLLTLRIEILLHGVYFTFLCLLGSDCFSLCHGLNYEFLFSYLRYFKTYIHFQFGSSPAASTVPTTYVHIISMFIICFTGTDLMNLDFK